MADKRITVSWDDIQKHQVTKRPSSGTCARVDVPPPPKGSPSRRWGRATLCVTGIMMLTILLCPALAKLFTPSRDKLDVNAQALLALEEGAYSGEYPSLRSHAAAARVYATDPDIIEMCERWITVADLSAKSGITRFAEADGLSGNLKLFFTGFVNPQTGIDALVLLGKEAWDGSNDIGSRIESRYRPLVDGYNSAVRSTRILVYVVTLGAAVLCCGYIIARSRKGDIPP